MNNINEVVEFYKSNDINVHNKHKKIYEEFEKNVKLFHNGTLEKHYNITEGFGELAFYWNWYLIINEMGNNFKFLEIGVYKGKVLSLIQLLSDLLNKNSQIFGITPLNTSSDKYSQYLNADYLEQIKQSFGKSNLSFNNTKIIKGYSQDSNIIDEASLHKEYDIIFIDGCHDYEIVCLDIFNYSKMLKVGGYLIMDDASSLLEGAYGQFLGHNDVGKAIKDCIDNDNNFEYLYAVGHNRVWRKK